MFCDIAIVGGGTAACAAWLTLRERGPSIVVVAPDAAEGDRPGESLSAGADQLIEQLGIAREFEAVPKRASHSVYSSWGSALLAQRSSLGQPDGMGYVLDRTAFDRMLQRALHTRGAVVIPQTVREASCDAGAWHLRLSDESEITARFVIDCSGRSAIIARTMTYIERADQLVAAYAFASSHDDDVEPTAATLIEAVHDGWWYATLLPDRRMSVAFFTGAHTLPNGISSGISVWHGLLEQTRFAGKWLESAGYRFGQPPRIATAATTWLERPCGANWAAAGDAAAAFDPLSSYGLVTALWSGRRAALGAVAALNGGTGPLQDYVATVKRLVETTLAQRAQIYAQERRFGNAPFWNSKNRTTFAAAKSPKDAAQNR